MCNRPNGKGAEMVAGYIGIFIFICMLVALCVNWLK